MPLGTLEEQMSMNDGGSSPQMPGSPSKAGEAKEATKEVAASAVEGAKQVTQEVGAQARSVAHQAKDQIGQLVGSSTGELRQQAEARSGQAVEGMRSLSGQLDALVNGRPEQAETVLRYVQEGNDRLRSLADRLEQRGPQGVLDDVGRFARQRPGLFLLCAVGAGVAAGRMVRANKGATPEDRASQTDDRWAAPRTPAGLTQGSTPTPGSNAASYRPATIATIDPLLADGSGAKGF